MSDVKQYEAYDGHLNARVDGAFVTFEDYQKLVLRLGEWQLQAEVEAGRRRDAEANYAAASQDAARYLGDRDIARGKQIEAERSLAEALERDRKGDEIIIDLTLDRDNLARRLQACFELVERPGLTEFGVVAGLCELRDQHFQARLVERLVPGCQRSHPHENMNEECERKTVEAREKHEQANR